MSRSSTQFTHCVISAFSSAAKAECGLRPGRKPWAEAYKVGLVDGIQHFGYRALDNLVLERWYAERPTATVAFRDVCAAYRLWPVLPTVDPPVQTLEVAR